LETFPGYGLLSAPRHESRRSILAIASAAFDH
jgi:hypothetical protein